MEISEVRVKLIGNPTDRLKAFASVTLDGDFVIRDIKVIDGASGVFVAMPSRKLADRCPQCGCKNHLRARYCNECGKPLPKSNVPRDKTGRSKLHADIAHPINSACRQRLQEEVVQAYKSESERSKQPDYQPITDEEYLDDDSGYDDLIEELKRDAADRRETRPQGDRPDHATVLEENGGAIDTAQRESPGQAAPEPEVHEPPAGRSIEEQTEEPDDFGVGIA